MRKLELTEEEIEICLSALYFRYDDYGLSDNGMELMNKLKKFAKEI